MKRLRKPELMDDPALKPEQHLHALLSLNRVNRFLGRYGRLYADVCRLAGKGGPALLDLGCGGAGFPSYAADQGNGRGARESVTMIALDRSAFALRQARQWHGPKVDVVCADARALPLADNCVDIVVSQLFCHHFFESYAALILKEAARVARKGVVFDDLSRSRLSLIVTWVITRLISRSHVFHVDGPRSVRAAFRAEELVGLAESAGLVGAKVVRRFPFRMVLTWEKAFT